MDDCFVEGYLGIWGHKGKPLSTAGAFDAITLFFYILDICVFKFTIIVITITTVITSNKNSSYAGLSFYDVYNFIFCYQPPILFLH